MKPGKKRPHHKRKSAEHKPARIDKHSPPAETFKPKSISQAKDSWRLNKYIANSGVCSRREADTLIADGKVTVNGKVVTEMGVQVTRKDRVTVDGAEVNPTEFVYILLNKPKNHITTTEDEKGRRTVMDLVADATGHRVYPVGRLDRQTTGLLLLTNDGDLANRLMHPRYKVRKIYEVQTAEPIGDEQLNALQKGVELEDGIAAAHTVSRVPGHKNIIRLTLFEGRNRQVRRMMEAVGHSVTELCRTTYAGLNIRGLRNGRWRYLTPPEVNELRTLVKLFILKEK